ncbi:GntR family transcriptional regulator [Acidobacteriota bacterium]
MTILPGNIAHRAGVKRQRTTMVLDIDPANPLPIYRQIVEQLIRQIALGVLRPGDRVPTVRELAVQARVNRNTTARAVQVLESRGLVHTRVGQGTFVSEKARSVAKASADAWLDQSLDRLLDEAVVHGVKKRDVARKLNEKIKSTGSKDASRADRKESQSGKGKDK